MTQPVSYLQTDPRWGSLDYSAAGEKTTIAASGCGPTAMAMVLATWADPSVTPETECAWALRHGYKAPHSGTYYGYFGPAGARYGLTVTRLNGTSLYGNAKSPFHHQAEEALDRGCLVIACMGKGNWTSSGHYIVVWWQDGKVRINDPASTREDRLNGDIRTFRSQVKYYFRVDAEAYNGEDEDMTDEKFNELMERWLKARGEQKADGWAAPLVEQAVTAGITDGSRPKSFATRQEVMAMVLAAAEQ